MKQPYFYGEATGRLDVMGGIADYSGSLVLQIPIDESTQVKLQLNEDDIISISSKSTTYEKSFKAKLSEIPFSYPEVQAYFKADPATLWAAYVVGCLVVLKQEKGIEPQGMTIEISSSVPEGKGVSSSAALEVATMKALAQAFNIPFEGTELPRLAQKVENFVVGAPCGLMDQLASYFGVQDHLLPIVCQPDKLSAPIKIPKSIRFVGLDSGVRHAVSGASYGDVRTAAFMGYSLIANHLGMNKKQLNQAQTSGSWAELPFGGYLTNISVQQFEKEFLPILRNLSGEEFITNFGTTIDRISNVHPKTFYNVINCTKHPVEENVRVHQFRDLILNFKDSKEEKIKLGKLMYASHESYSKCGLGNEKTDFLVDLAKQYGSAQGIYGAKITGGGSGGTVCLLVDAVNGLETAKKLFEDYKNHFGISEKLVVFE